MILVAGGGLSALRTVEALRAGGCSARIVVVGAEPHPPYNRPPLTKQALRHGIDREALRFPQRAKDVEWMLGRRVTSVDLAARRATLDEGELVGYDGLVIATGVRSRGVADQRAGRHRVRTADDAEQLRSKLTAGARVVVVGAGFIGCEVAATATELGCSATVVEPLQTPLQAAVGRLVGDELRRRHEERGVRFRLGRTVVQAGDEGVVLDDGSRIAGDVVVEAAGSVPNVEWLEGNGLDLSNGVLCDAELRPLTADGPMDGVVAVGDVARFAHRGFGDVPLRIEHWTMCGDTARQAAKSLIGGTAAEMFAPLPSFWSEQFGTRLQSYGVPALGLTDIRLMEGALGNECAVGYHRGGELVGVVLLGLRSRMMHYREELAGQR